MFSTKDPIFVKFWVPNRSRHELKDFHVKNWVFFAFLQFPSRELPGIWTKSDSLEWKLQGFRPAEMAKMVKMLDQKVWELSTLKKRTPT